MSIRRDRDKDFAGLDKLIEDIIVSAYNVEEQLWAFHKAFQDNIILPANSWVIGEPVSVIEIDYDGNERRGLTAQCRREDGSVYEVAVSEVVFPEDSIAAHYTAAYRKWLGLAPYQPQALASPRHKRQHKVTIEDLDLSNPVELVILSVKERAARCRLPGRDRMIMLRAGRLWRLVPGEIVKVRPRKQWVYAGYSYLSGEIESTRLDVAALGLVPLHLEDMGLWDPQDEYWGEDDEPIEEWAGPIIAYGPRPAFEMEQVLPNADPDNFDSDPIIESNYLKDASDHKGAIKILMDLCQSDLRCLDAHAHLGSFFFDGSPREAIRHYEVGLRIGEVSLGGDFTGVLQWGHINNRPFLRCMHGYGLCLWRLGRFGEAMHLFNRMLWLNPSDNQGVRFLIPQVEAGKPWEQYPDEESEERGT